MGRDWEDVKRELFEDSPELRDDYEDSQPAYLLAREMLGARAELGISQAELARRMDTSQSVVSRLENMDTSPTLRTVMAVAKALGRRVELRFVGEDDRQITASDSAVGSDEVISVTRDQIADIVRSVVNEVRGEVISINTARSARSPAKRTAGTAVAAGRKKTVVARSAKTGRKVAARKTAARKRST